MNRSETIGKLSTALAKAQSEMDDAVADSDNPHFRSKYADLASVRAAVRKPLSDAGIAITQLPRYSSDAGTVEVETMLVHGESGEWISETLSIPVGQRTAHGIGSAITYARRFALMAMLGIAPAEDDDGNAASEQPRHAARPAPGQQKAPAKPAPKAPPRTADPERGGYGPQKNNVDVVGTSSGYVTQPETVATAGMLLEGTTGREGLRSIARRVVAARKALEDGKEPPTREHAPYALNDAYDAWESWQRSVRPLLSKEDTDVLLKAMGVTAKEMKRLDAAVAKHERAATAKAAGADPDTGELPVYEAPEAVA